MIRLMIASMLKVHKVKIKHHNKSAEDNSRLDELQAAILRVNLPRNDVWNKGRREVTQRYNALLKGVSGILTPREASNRLAHLPLVYDPRHRWQA